MEIEQALLRMIHGAARFLREGLTEWLYELIFKTLIPASIRLARVLLLVFIWLIIAFGPYALGQAGSLGSKWFLFSLLWAGLAIAGSYWGFHHYARGRRLPYLFWPRGNAPDERGTNAQ